MTTRAQLRTDALNIADANGAQRWDTTEGTGEVDRRLSFVYDREWRRILDAQPYALTAKRTPTADSDGKIALTELSVATSGGGGSITTERLYRILLVAFGGYPYEDASQQSRDFFLAQLHGGVGRRWYRDATQLWVPQAAGLTADGVWVNYLPRKFTLYASDDTEVELPDNYDDIFAHEAAAALLVKGGAETGAALELKAFAREMRDEYLASYQKLSLNPLGFRYSDDPSEWGG